MPAPVPAEPSGGAAAAIGPEEKARRRAAALSLKQHRTVTLQRAEVRRALLPPIEPAGLRGTGLEWSRGAGADDPTVKPMPPGLMSRSTVPHARPRRPGTLPGLPGRDRDPNLPGGRYDKPVARSSPPGGSTGRSTNRPTPMRVAAAVQIQRWYRRKLLERAELAAAKADAARKLANIAASFL